jgi:hypothetical protein
MPETSPVVALMPRCAGRLGFARNSMAVAARAARTVRLKGNRDSGAPTMAGVGGLVEGSSQPRCKVSASCWSWAGEGVATDDGERLDSVGWDEGKGLVLGGGSRVMAVVLWSAIEGRLKKEGVVALWARSVAVTVEEGAGSRVAACVGESGAAPAVVAPPGAIADEKVPVLLVAGWAIMLGVRIDVAGGDGCETAAAVDTVPGAVEDATTVEDDVVAPTVEDDAVAPTVADNPAPGAAVDIPGAPEELVKDRIWDEGAREDALDSVDCAKNACVVAAVGTDVEHAYEHQKQVIWSAFGFIVRNTAIYHDLWHAR